MATPRFTTIETANKWAKMYESGMNAVQIADEVGVHASTVYYQLKKIGAARRLNGGNVGESHYRWKGDKVGYWALHKWVARRMPSGGICNSCKQRKKCDLANVSQRYKRELSDWEWLCRKCHMLSDGRLENLRNYAK